MGGCAVEKRNGVAVGRQTRCCYEEDEGAKGFEYCMGGGRGGILGGFASGGGGDGTGDGEFAGGGGESTGDGSVEEEELCSLSCRR